MRRRKGKWRNGGENVKGEKQKRRKSGIRNKKGREEEKKRDRDR